MTDQSVTAAEGECPCADGVASEKCSPRGCEPPDRERRRAADLRTGDRIIPGDLVGATDAESVLGVHAFPDIDGTPMVMVVSRPDGREQVFSQYWRADASLALAAGSGAYGRDVDNGDPAAVVPEGVAGEAVGRAAVGPKCDCDPDAIVHDGGCARGEWIRGA